MRSGPLGELVQGNVHKGAWFTTGCPGTARPFPRQPTRVSHQALSDKPERQEPPPELLRAEAGRRIKSRNRLGYPDRRAERDAEACFS